MATTETTILQDVLNELKVSRRSTSWPDHPVGQAGLVSNASGMLLTASIDWKYNRATTDLMQDAQKNRMRREAIQTAVMALRFIENL